MKLLAPCLLVAVLVVFSVGMPANAQPNAGFVYGLGSDSCGTWNTDRHDFTTHLAQFSWVEGFVTGVTLVTPTVKSRDTDADGMEQWMDQYCQQHPLTRLIGASEALLDALKVQ